MIVLTLENGKRIAIDPERICDIEEMARGVTQVAWVTSTEETRFVSVTESFDEATRKVKDGLGDVEEHVVTGFSGGAA